MADRNSEELQDAVDAAAGLAPTPQDTTSSDSDMDNIDYEPDIDDDSDGEAEDLVERLLEAAVDGTADIWEIQNRADGDVQVVVQETGDEGIRQRITLSRHELQRFFRLRARAEQGLLDEEDDEEDGDEDEEDGWIFRARRRRRPLDPNRFPKVPSEAGTELMRSGIFGSDEAQSVTEDQRNNVGRKKKLARRILDRELAIESPAKQRLNQRLMAQGMIPSSNPDMIIHYDQPVYSGQFSNDGNFFFSANKDFKVRMYDTSNPYKWRYYKTVEYYHGQWTLTDATLSPDNKYLAYTSIRHTVCLAPTDPNDHGDPYVLDLAETGDPRTHLGHRRRGGAFGIWSIRYSGDGRQLVAGTNGGSIITYDIESRRATNRIFGHDEDVNAVCFADSSSPHILYSGSDDTTLKVWDTRSMGDSRAAGAFIGHIEGLTYIDSKGDGRYILSNGKDQSMKLWDLRMVMPNSTFEKVNPRRRATTSQHFDYRWGTYDEDDWYPDPHDNSVVTFRGHKVLRTLIRCHFSPAASTNSRYVYSGSEDGKVYVYNMDATIAGVIDVYGTTKNTRPRGRHEYEMIGGWDDDGHNRWRTCVRDASWHPNAPMIVASAWNGYGMATGTCSVHSWNDGGEEDEAEPKMGLRVDQKLNTNDEYYYRTTEDTPPRRRFGMGLTTLLRGD